MTPIPKPRPKMLDKRKAKADVDAEDRRENAKMKKRSGGRCEVVVISATYRQPWRCPRRAFHPHHLISGIGRRNVGKSIKSEHKLHVCEACHDEIHGRVLKPENDVHRYEATKVRFIRIT